MPKIDKRKVAGAKRAMVRAAIEERNQFDKENAAEIRPKCKMADVTGPHNHFHSCWLLREHDGDHRCAICTKTFTNGVSWDERGDYGYGIIAS